MEKQIINWEWTDNWGRKWDGYYEGMMKHDKPHGLGIWKRDDDERTMEGEWNKGQLNGKVVVKYSDGDLE